MNAAPLLRACGAALLAAAMMAAPAATAAPAAPPTAAAPPPADPPYQAQLERLAEILGALHYIRPLCGAKEPSLWRDQMQALIAAEDPVGRRRGRLVDRFNIGYSGFASVYRICTASAVAAAERYRREAAQLARDIATRYAR